MRPTSVVALSWIVGLLLGCQPPVGAQPAPLVSTSGTVRAAGLLQRLSLPEVSGVTLREGRLFVRGATEEVPIDLPSFIDTAQVIRHWALVTEADRGGKRLLSFTHDQSLDEFTLELPPTDADIKYGVFAHRDGGEVMVLAWGRESRCYWGYVRIEPRAAAAPR